MGWFIVGFLVGTVTTIIGYTLFLVVAAYASIGKLSDE